MTIAVNAIFFNPANLEGYGHYTLSIFHILVKQHPHHQFVFIYDRPHTTDLITGPNVQSITVGPAARHLPGFFYWYNISAAMAVKKIKADVWVQPYGFCSQTSQVPQLLVVHDLAFKHFPQYISWMQRWHYAAMTPLFLKKAKRVVTVSEFSKQDIIAAYPQLSKSPSVIAGAARKGFAPLSWEEKEQVKEAYTDGYEYFLCVGGIHPRKNMIHLLKAFSLFKKWHKTNMKLVFVGRLAWQYKDFLEKLKSFKYRKDVVLTGYVEENILQKLTGAAYGALYVTHFEGFGLPIVEAMQSGVPVITANNSSMPEVGGDAALYAESNNPASIAAQMQILYRNEQMREKLIQKGLERAQYYSWDKSAALFWEEIIATNAVSS
ncbi:glycosyltransferase family 4 protein [Sediminibacterium sp.]|uniref:glycosyltransferase family 4 protein n=1 Tax=Sediminibacterium sp. TaxID=1917865 RepID=UPI003F6FF4A9